MQAIVDFILDAVSGMGYWGIFFLMLLESSFFPFPSEVVMIPAGYLVYKGEMNMFYVLLAGTLGSLAGALINYYIAKRWGRAFLLRYSRFLFIDEKRLAKMERFFKNHGHISTFSGRLIPGVRQYISFPAGLAKMHLGQFSLYTSLGAGIWVCVLALLGYYLGGQEEIIKEYLRYIIVGILLLLILLAYFYIKAMQKDKTL
ncbi:MAG: DedA family protein [Campylobacterota bacterium]